MGHSAKTRRQAASALDAASLARPLAPEDVRAGDYVAILDEICELPSYFWNDCDALAPRDQLVRIRHIPASEAVPMKVRGVCLPFVLVKQPTGPRRTLDVRKSRLARLDPTFARAAWKAYKKSAANVARSAESR